MSLARAGGPGPNEIIRLLKMQPQPEVTAASRRRDGGPRSEVRHQPAIYCAPFTVIVAPLMKAASSEAR